jgi:hypothetical protein
MQVTSTSAYYSGHVVIPDEMSWDNYMDWEETVASIADYAKSGKKLTLARYVHFYIPAVCKIVTEWHIEHLSAHPQPSDIPPKPIAEIAVLIGDIVEAIAAKARELAEIPNA